MKTVRVLKIQKNDNEPSHFLMSDKEASQHFFENLVTNMAAGDSLKISTEELTPEQWTEGEETA